MGRTIEQAGLLSTYSQKNLADSGVSLTNLLAYYKLDGNFTDTQGSYNLSTVGTPTDVNGLFSGAKNFVASSSQAGVTSGAAGLRLTTSRSISGWIYPTTSLAANKVPFGFADSTNTYMFRIREIDTTGTMWGELSGVTGGTVVFANKVVLNMWQHLVLVYDSSSNTLTAYIDGVQSSVGVTGSHTATNEEFAVGRMGGFSGNYWDGYVDDVSVWGKALSSTEVQDIYKAGGACVGYWKLDQSEDTNTKLLLHFNGADAATSTIESSTGKAVTFVNQAQIDTAQKKFGSSSLLLDGTTDSITLADSADWSFGTGSFTIDMWLRFNVLPTNGGSSQAIINQYVDTNNYWSFSAYNNAGTYMWLFYHKTGGTTTITVEKNSTGLSTGTWYHVALVRNGNDFMVFQDGVQQGTTVTDTDSISDFATVLRIGDRSLEAGFNGWIDELRVVKGTAKWTTGFTVPSVPYSFQTDDWSNNGYHLITGTQPANTTGLYDQAGDFESTNSTIISLINASVSNLNITGSRTISLWYKPETAIASSVLVGKEDGGTNGYYLFLTSPAKTPSLVIRGLTTNVQVTSSTSGITDGTWNHICGVYDSTATKLKIFYNGVSTEATASGSSTNSTKDFAIGGYNSTAGAGGSAFADGIIDDVAIFNRALTDAEVLSIYLSGSPKIIFF